MDDDFQITFKDGFEGINEPMALVPYREVKKANSRIRSLRQGIIRLQTERAEGYRRRVVENDYELVRVRRKLLETEKSRDVYKEDYYKSCREAAEYQRLNNHNYQVAVQREKEAEALKARMFELQEEIVALKKLLKPAETTGRTPRQKSKPKA